MRNVFIAAVAIHSICAVVVAGEPVFENSGDSTAPFFCHWGDVWPQVDPDVGNPSPSLEYETGWLYSYNFAPYVLPGLLPSQVFHGSLSFMIGSATGVIVIADFGQSVGPSCDYDPWDWSADKRYPVPGVFLYHSDTIGSFLETQHKNELGEIVLVRKPFSISTQEWHTAEVWLKYNPAGWYDFDAAIDGQIVSHVESHEVLYENDHLAVRLGDGSSGAGTHVWYDNILVEVIDHNLVCQGFQPPLVGGPVTARGNRALPVKAQLFNTDGFLMTDLEVTAPPVIQVTYQSAAGGEPQDVTGDALPAGMGTEGNESEYNLVDHVWQYNLKTKNYTAVGTYTITMMSGDDSEYLIDPTCEATFVRAE